MVRRAALACLFAAGVAWAAPPKTSAELLAQSPASDWRLIDPANTLYMEIPSGRVVIELAAHFAPNVAANIRTLAKAGYYDGLAIVRAQDNFVVQWGDPTDTEKEPQRARSMGEAEKKLPAEFETTAKDLRFTPLPDRDGWAPQVGFADGARRLYDWLAHQRHQVAVPARSAAR